MLPQPNRPARRDDPPARPAAAPHPRGAGPALVSVVMSVHNGLPYLDEAVRSILGQTYPNLEFVFVDDGSTDGSRERLRQWAARDARVRLIEQANTGLTRALVHGVAAARGAFIARMDADDVSHPQRIARQVAELERDARTVAVSCGLHYIDANGRIKDTVTRACEPDLMAWHLTFSNYVAGHSQVIFRRDAYEAVGGYDASFRFSQDYELWSRLAEVGRIVTLAEVLQHIRVDYGASISSRSWHAQLACSLRTTQRNFERLTGQRLDDTGARLLREFWDHRGDIRLSPEQAPRVDALLGAAYRGFVAADPARRRLRRALRQLLARRWNYWVWQTELAQPAVIAAYASRVVRWSPWLAPRVTASLARRVAGWPGRALRAARGRRSAPA